MKQLRKAVDRVLEFVLIVIMSAMTLNVLWQVFSRFLLRSPSSYTEELARYLLIWLGLLGTAYGVSRGAHLAIDLLPAHLGVRNRHLLQLILNLLMALFAIPVLVIGGVHLVAVTLAYHQASPTLPIELGWVYLAIPLSGMLIVFYAFLGVLEEVRAFRADEEETASDRGPVCEQDPSPGWKPDLPPHA